MALNEVNIKKQNGQKLQLVLMCLQNQVLGWFFFKCLLSVIVWEKKGRRGGNNFFWIALFWLFPMNTRKNKTGVTMIHLASPTVPHSNHYIHLKIGSFFMILEYGNGRTYRQTDGIYIKITIPYGCGWGSATWIKSVGEGEVIFTPSFWRRLY